ncbi:asd-4 [Ecytonucleospora hepatopenaei]|uniref:Asd-4 n=1 Tax=Ecytonucleospora hepatopenaei TaxID=646526 RepID=A0A1W0E3S1_9MICR|nr:asd-4 [Ecytonucleospora hepatopenaei]
MGANNLRESSSDYHFDNTKLNLQKTVFDKEEMQKGLDENSTQFVDQLKSVCNKDLLKEKNTKQSGNYTQMHELFFNDEMERIETTVENNNVFYDHPKSVFDLKTVKNDSDKKIFQKQIFDDKNPCHKNMKEKKSSENTKDADNLNAYENYASYDDEAFYKMQARMSNDPHLFYTNKDGSYPQHNMYATYLEGGQEQDFMLSRNYYQQQLSPRKKGKQAARKKPKIRICSNCKTTSTPSWRRGGNGRMLLCNACGLYLKLHGRNRPFAVNSEGKTKALKSTRTEVYCIVCNAQGDATNMIATTSGTACINCSAYFNRQILENNIVIDPTQNYTANYNFQENFNMPVNTQYAAFYDNSQSEIYAVDNSVQPEYVDPMSFYQQGNVEESAHGENYHVFYGEDNEKEDNKAHEKK